MNRTRTIRGAVTALALTCAMVFIAPTAANAEDGAEVIDETTSIVDAPAPAEDVVEEVIVQEEVVEEDVEDIPEVVPPTEEERKGPMCHRTNSVTNPYTLITVDFNAMDGISGNSNGNPDDHYGEHQGPLASSEEVAQALKDDKIEWGDIIPPIEGVHDGLNWSTEGQAIFNNGCSYVTVDPEPLIATASVSITLPTCTSGAILNWGTAVNSEFAEGSTPNGTVGPADYTVTADANENAKFSTGDVQLILTGSLDGRLSGPECGELALTGSDRDRIIALALTVALLLGVGGGAVAFDIVRRRRAVAPLFVS